VGGRGYQFRSLASGTDSVVGTRWVGMSLRSSYQWLGFSRVRCPVRLLCSLYASPLGTRWVGGALGARVDPAAVTGRRRLFVMEAPKFMPDYGATKRKKSKIGLLSEQKAYDDDDDDEVWNC